MSKPLTSEEVVAAGCGVIVLEEQPCGSIRGEDTGVGVVIISALITEEDRGIGVVVPSAWLIDIEVSVL
jgi:hypothetical protein